MYILTSQPQQKSARGLLLLRKGSKQPRQLAASQTRRSMDPHSSNRCSRG